MKTARICLFICLAALQVGAAQLEKLTDLPKAQAKAKAEGKYVLLFFTISDLKTPKGVGRSAKCQQEVFSKPEFAEYAQKNLVFVEVDFPRQNAQTAAQKAANRELKEAYKIRGYPTFILLNGEGKQIAKEVGYATQTPSSFIAMLEKMKQGSWVNFWPDR